MKNGENGEHSLIIMNISDEKTLITAHFSCLGDLFDCTSVHREQKRLEFLTD